MLSFMPFLHSQKWKNNLVVLKNKKICDTNIPSSHRALLFFTRQDAVEGAGIPSKRVKDSVAYILWITLMRWYKASVNIHRSRRPIVDISHAMNNLSTFCFHKNRKIDCRSEAQHLISAPSYFQALSFNLSSQ